MMRYTKGFGCISMAFVLGSILFSCKQKENKYSTWENFGGTKDNIHYSSLTQIDTSNVQQLKVAWVYHTNDADTVNHSQIQCNPLIVDGIVYGTTPQLKLFAVDGATGTQKWVFNPIDTIAGKKSTFFIMNNCRGVAYWSDGNNKRILYTVGSNLYSINAENGRPDTAFGDAGKIDLHDGLGRDVQKLFVTATSPGIVYKDLIVMGTRVDEGAAAAPGHIRAYDVHTGKIKWIFHTIPYPGEEGYDSWDDKEAYKHIGGANCWSGFSLDEKRGIVFAATGSASFDFYGGKRLGNDLFANCILALNANTGKRIWHFQGVHHDVWDRDFPAAPLLVTIRKDGNTIDAVAQVSKSGFVYLFDRTTGKPIFPIREVSVPSDTLNGERLSPTQPIPEKPAPFVRQIFSEKDINPLLPDSSIQIIKNKLRTYATGNMFNPPSKNGTIVLPGLDGGGEWGGASFDPSTGLLYINANEMAWVITIVDLKDKSPANETYIDAGKRLYQLNCMSCHGPNREGSGNYPTLVGINKKYSEPQLYQLISSGRRMMPAFSQLPEQDKKAIASFVLDINRKEKYVRTITVDEQYTHLPYTISGYNKFLASDGLPALAPPWGTLSALNLNTGEYVWKDTLGDDKRFASRGVHTGSENYGGPVTTAGGLLIIAATKDSKLRIFNKRTGQLLKEIELPVPAFATPSIYEVKGKEYIVVACGGGKLGATSGDAYMAFSLTQ
jgi:Glucose dehydrogenase